jgi:hypothetical protein
MHHHSAYWTNFLHYYGAETYFLNTKMEPAMF